MGKEKIRRFIIVPDEVIQSQNLNNGAKLLLGYIMRLSNKCGYCWASNKHFADYFDMDRATIIRWINELKEYGYIRCKKGIKRKIYIDRELLRNIHYCPINKTTANMRKTICKIYQYKLWKKKVKERDKEKCRLCGITEKQQIENHVSMIGLEVHHVIPIILLIDYHHIRSKEEAKKCKALWDISNGITLCDKCHRIKHGIRYWDVLIDETGFEEIGCENATIKNATGRRNADIDNTTYYKQQHFRDAAAKDDFNIESSEWIDEQGVKHRTDSIDYES